jgi:hypothetical protein
MNIHPEIIFVDENNGFLKMSRRDFNDLLESGSVNLERITKFQPSFIEELQYLTFEDTDIFWIEYHPRLEQRIIDAGYSFSH